MKYKFKIGEKVKLHYFEPIMHDAGRRLSFTEDMKLEKINGKLGSIHNYGSRTVKGIELPVYEINLPGDSFNYIFPEHALELIGSRNEGIFRDIDYFKKLLLEVTRKAL